MVVVLWILLVSIGSALLNSSALLFLCSLLAVMPLIELVNYNGFFFVEASMTNFGSKKLLFDTNAPALLVKSSFSTKKDSTSISRSVHSVETFDIITDLETTTILLLESWRRNIIIYNDRRGETGEIPLIEAFPYHVAESVYVEHMCRYRVGIMDFYPASLIGRTMRTASSEWDRRR